MIEEKRICAFIDVLGFKNEILTSNDERRTKIIKLIEDIKFDDIRQGMNSENLTFATISRPSAEVTSFSDNIVISANIPLIDPDSPPNSFTEKELNSIKYMEHIFIKIISVYWRALQLGLLFRGGITVGNLYHKNGVVVGEALINSYELETNTSYPRIEVSNEVVNILKKSALTDIDNILLFNDNRYIVNVFCFHLGVWWDYQHLNNIQNLAFTEVISIVDGILEMAQNNYEKYLKEDNKRISDKWKWFIDTMTKEYNKGHWLKIKQGITEREKKETQ